MDGKNYLDLKTRPSDSYLELETRPSDSYLELDERPSKTHLELEAKPSDYPKLVKRPSNSNLDGQSGPSDSYMESKARPSDSYLDIDFKPPSSYSGLPDEFISSQTPTKGGIPTSQPTQDEIIVYDDTLSPQNKSAEGAFLHPSSCSSSSYPAWNALPLDGTGRKGQALPDPPPEAGVRYLNSCNTNYNTANRRKNCQENATSHESAIRELSDAGRGLQASPSRCCICCRDVVWLFIGLAMTAACIGGSYYTTRTVVAELCTSNSFSPGDASTTLYGEVEFKHFNGTANRTVFDPWFKNNVENALKDTVLSFFLKNVTVHGLSKAASTSGRICMFTITLRLDESKRRGLQDVALNLLEQKFPLYSLEGATLRCIVIRPIEARIYSCPDRMMSLPTEVTSSGVTSSGLTSSGVTSE